MFVLLPFFTLKRLELQFSKRNTTIVHNTFRHWRIRFYAFVGQPLLETPLFYFQKFLLIVESYCQLITIIELNNITILV